MCLGGGGGKMGGTDSLLLPEGLGGKLGGIFEVSLFQDGGDIGLLCLGGRIGESILLLLRVGGGDL